MRCCKSCGCYLPDGVSKCLACGYDETAVEIVPRSGIGIDRSGYGLGQWSKDVRNPMRIAQAPVMPIKTENSGSCINVGAKSVSYNEENARHKYTGFSYSGKPKHGVPGGSMFYEIDTGNTYMFIKEYRMWFLLYQN